MSKPVGHSIGFVSSQTGLSTHVIRAWERRYGAVSPQRSPTGRRIYDRADIARLNLLKKAVSSGHGISGVADLDNDELLELLGVSQVSRHTRYDPANPLPENLLEDCMESVALLDSRLLHRQIQDGHRFFSRRTLFCDVIRPLMERIGTQWATGNLRIVHGHMAAAVVMAQMGAMLTHRAEDAIGNPLVVVAAPAGQYCCIGALAITVMAQDFGFEAVFLGHNLPAEEISAAASALSPQRIALSITCRLNDSFVEEELLRLAELVDGRYPIIVGGRASPVYQPYIEKNVGSVCDTIEVFFGM